MRNDRTSRILLVITIFALAASFLIAVGGASAREPDAAPSAAASPDTRIVPYMAPAGPGRNDAAHAQQEAWIAAHPGQLRTAGDRAEFPEPAADPHGGGVAPLPGPAATSPAAATGFDGMNNVNEGHNTVPSDMGMAVGPTYVVQAINSADGGYVGIFNKATGAKVQTFAFSSKFSAGQGNCASGSESDPNALYDSGNDRYFLQFFTTSGTEYWCILYSATNDPTGAWYAYATPVGSCGSSKPSTDYQHSGVWIDGIYTATNQYSAAGQFQNAGVFVFNRDDMKAGAAMRCGYVDLPSMKISGSETVFRPIVAGYDIKTGTPPAGRPAYALTAWNAGASTSFPIRAFRLTTTWGASSATVTQSETDVSVNTRSLAPTTVTSTANALDTLGDAAMQPLKYWTDGTTERLGFAKTVRHSTTTGVAEIRPYEIQLGAGGTIPGTPREQSNFEPDTVSRFQPFGAYDRSGNRIVAYSKTSSSVHPSVWFTGRLAGDTAGTWGAEASSKVGQAGFSAICGGTCTRWGDYGDAAVDMDGCTVWFSFEYMPGTTNGLNWGTWIGSARHSTSACTSYTYGKSAPGSQAFGSVIVGSTSSAQTITITNTGTGPLVLQTPTKGGANPGDFAVTGNTCASPVAASGTCTLTMTFTPGASGARSATLNVGTNVAAGDNIAISLSGTGASPPTTSASLSGTIGTNGWYTSAVTVTLTCAPVSPATCASTTYAVDGGATQTYSAPFAVSGDSATHVVTFSSTDSGGATETLKTSTIKIDATAPTFSLSSRLPAANANGWNNANVVVTFACSDATSGAVAASVSSTVSTEGASQTATSTCTDNAGNTATASQGGISIDKTAPTGTGSRTPAANAQGWNNVDVTASATCSDALSGIPAQPASQTVTAQGASQSRSFTCTDAAGNTASVTVGGISIDKTAPSVSGTRSPAANANGWNKVDVTASFTCTDALSGVQSAPSSVVLSSEGAGQSASGSCTDKADNTASATVSGVSIDKTAPALAPHANLNAEATGPSGAVVGYSLPSASDALSGAGAVSCSPASGSGFALGTTSIACSVSDLAGNSASSTFSVTVVDTTPPTIAPHADVAAEATGASGAVVTYAAPGTSDLVGGAGLASCSPASGSGFAQGTTTVSCSATDAAGNTATSSFLVTVSDTIAPVIDAASDVTAEATSAGGATVAYSSPSTHDAVDGDGVADCSPASGSLFALGDTTVTCTATDAAGNVASPVSFTMSVVDTTAPVIDAMGDVTAEATSAAGATVSFSALATSDAVDGAGVADCSPLSGGLFALGDTTVTCSATDAAGNAASPVSFVVSVVDTTAPTLDAVSDLDAEATDANGATVGFSAPASHDLVDGDGVADCAPASGSVFAQGATTVLCSATDAAGNAASTSFTVTVSDTIAPVIDAASDVTAEATSASGANVAFVAPATSDAVDGAGVADCSPVSGSLFALGDTTVTCTATDAAGNVASPVSFTVSVVDTTAPTIGEIGDAVVEAIGASGAPFSFVTPDTDDAVDGAGVADCSPTPGSTFPLGDTVVTCTATDAAGNTASRSFTVSVVDTTAPSIDAISDIAVDADGPSGSFVSFASPASHDLVDGDSSAECAPSSGSLFPLGVTTVTCSATDAAGNAAQSVSFTVLVGDATAPVIDAVDDIVAEAASAAGAIVNYAAPSTHDAVDGDGIADCAPASGTLFALGATTVTCTAADEAGNTASRSFTVSVVDTTAPSIDAASDVAAEATSAGGAAVTFDAPATSDLVDGAGLAGCSPASGSVFALGETTVTCAATDAAGNAASPVTFTVAVVDTTAPVIDAASDVTAEATSAAGALVSFGSPATSDLVDGAGMADCSPVSGSLFALGDTTIVCSATDEAGNTATSSFMVSVVDTTAPSIDSAANIAVGADGASGSVVSFAAPDTHDLVDGVGVADCSPASGSLFAIGATTVTCTATDAAGNAAQSVTFTVTVGDATAPVIDAVDDIVAEATSAAGAIVNYAAPSTHDAVDGDGIASCSPLSGSIFALGDTSATCTASDAAGNAASAVSFTVSVVDTTAPSIADAPDVTVEATGATGAIVTFAAPATADAVDGDGVADCGPASGSIFALGDTTVTCTASDAAGNAASSTSFTVSVVDTTAPVIDAMEDASAEATSAAGAMVSFDAPASSDAVDGAGVAECAPASGSVFALGETVVTCAASDMAGNAATVVTFTVTVVDTTAPVIDAADDVSAEATGADGALVSFSAPSTSDAVDGAGAADCAPASGSLFALGATTVTCTASDAAGNAAEPVSFTVTVADTTAPAIDAHANLAVNASGLSGALVTYTAPTTHDAVDGDGVASCAPASGTLFALGNTTVTCSATDAAGNVAAARTFVVRVTFLVNATLKAERATYSSLQAATDGVRATYHLQAGDGTPLRNVTVTVTILRQVQLVGYTDHETFDGATDANGDFVLEPSVATSLPANYVMIGKVVTPGIAGNAVGSYRVNAL